jgi:aryl-alcohol dehydrogenase-like predicted oxidoreductase
MRIENKSGEYTVGDFRINRLGFGAMRITGRDLWGSPEDPQEARRTLASLAELGINFIDTADSYGPHTSELMIREVLHPYPGMLVATKAGFVRPTRTLWVPCGRPDYLRQQVLLSLRHLGLERIDLWQLHRIDPTVPRDEQFEVVAEMQKEGLIRHVGLSEVTIPEIIAAQAYFEVVTVQNHYNLVIRQHEDVVDFCEANGIGFIPFYPLHGGAIAQAGSDLLNKLGAKYGGSPTQIMVAWLLKRSPAMLAIPGTGKLAHLKENVAATMIELSDDDYQAIATAAF